MKRATEKALKKMAGNGFPDVREALEEIERLREELLDSREAVEDWKQRWRDSDTEPGRLRSELNMEVVRRRKTEDELADWQVAVQQRNAEIERLRGKLAHVLRVVNYHRNDYNGAQIDPLIQAVREILGDE
jgi:chromosome segregation ATPase